MDGGQAPRLGWGHVAGFGWRVGRLGLLEVGGLPLLGKVLGVKPRDAVSESTKSSTGSDVQGEVNLLQVPTRESEK